MDIGTTNRIDRRARGIENRYDPEKDGHNVTWVDATLVEIIRDLQAEIEDLQAQINALKLDKTGGV